MRENKRKVLCVIVGSVQLTQEGTVEVSTTITESEKIDASKVSIIDLMLRVKHASSASRYSCFTALPKKHIKMVSGTLLVECNVFIADNNPQYGCIYSLKYRYMQMIRAKWKNRT